MAKPLFQDIIPPDRRSIKRIPIPQRESSGLPAQAGQQVPIRTQPRPTPPPRPEPVRRQTEAQYERVLERDQVERPQVEEHHYDQEVEQLYHVHDPAQTKVKKSIIPRVLITLLIAAIIVGASVWAMTRVNGATVTLTPKSEEVTVDSQFTASRESADGLQFQIVTYAKDGKFSLASAGQEHAETKASGIIVIYNKSTTAQTLVANTRFETEKGLIFRISQPISIPPSKIEGGRTVPGSIEAAVTADAIGPEYNVGLADFKVPGLKGDPRYDLIEARTKPQNPIQGGYKGMRNKVDDAELAKAREKVRTELKTNLVQELEKYIPQEFIMPVNGYVILYESLPDIQEANGIKINERAVFNGFIFRKTDLAQEISKKVRGVSALPSEVGDIRTLAFTVNSPVKEPWASPSIQFTLKGTTTLIATIDKDKLIQEILGKPRNSLQPILASYPAVSGVEVMMRPFWKRSFPSNKDEITLKVVNPQP